MSEIAFRCERGAPGEPLDGTVVTTKLPEQSINSNEQSKQTLMDLVFAFDLKRSKSRFEYVIEFSNAGKTAIAHRGMNASRRMCEFENVS